MSVICSKYHAYFFAHELEMTETWVRRCGMTSNTGLPLDDHTLCVSRHPMDDGLLYFSKGVYKLTVVQLRFHPKNTTR